MKFSDLSKGKRARETVTVQLAGVETKLDLRILSVTEEASAIQRGHAYAAARGVLTEDEDEPLYRLGLHIAALAFACVDSESPADKPAQFFESEVQIERCEEITLDEIEFLFARYMVFADEHGVRKAQLSSDEFLSLVTKSAGGDTLPFFGLRPGTQAAFITSLAALHLSFLRTSSDSSKPLQTATRNGAEQPMVSPPTPENGASS
jgi:hypothetical protein